jgi:hypothetical protein
MNRTERLRADALDAAVAAAAELASARAALDAAVARALHWEASWSEIGDAVGVSRQAAHRRFRHLRWDPATRTAWAERPLPFD